jgi:hypothetical protein
MDLKSRRNCGAAQKPSVTGLITKGKLLFIFGETEFRYHGIEGCVKL